MTFSAQTHRNRDSENGENRTQRMKTCMASKPFQFSKPLIVTMSMFGLLFLHCDKRRLSALTRVYSIIVFLVFLAIFVHGFFSYIGESFGFGSFLKLINQLWSLQCALNVIVTFKACNSENRFVEFLQKWARLLQTNRGNCLDDPTAEDQSSAEYEGFIKRRFNFFVVISWTILVFNCSSISYMLFRTHLFDFVILPMSPTHPLALHVKAVTILPRLYMSASWILTLSLFMSMSVVIHKEFEIFHKDLRKAIAADENLQSVEYFRCRYQDICQFVETADDILSGFNFSGIFLSTCEGMLILYSLVWSTEARADPRVLAAHVFWVVSVILYLIVISYGGGYLNHMAHAPLKSVFDVKVRKSSPEFSLQMNMFLMKLTGESIGLTALDMCVIDKPTILTIAGAFVTYFIVLIQFNQPASSPGSSSCNCTDFLVNSTLQCTANSWF